MPSPPGFRCNSETEMPLAESFANSGRRALGSMRAAVGWRCRKLVIVAREVGGELVRGRLIQLARSINDAQLGARFQRPFTDRAIVTARIESLRVWRELHCANDSVMPTQALDWRRRFNSPKIDFT